jgi:DNA repair exonuclease SbcCD ATPase subunit
MNQPIIKKIVDKYFFVCYYNYRKRTITKEIKTMMNTYVVEMMTYETYVKYMRGDLFFGNVIRVHIQAETKEQAIAKAEEQYKGYEINKNYVKTVEELAEIERQKKLEEENERIKKEQAEIRKANRELEKANAMGLTLEQYKEYKKEQAKRKRYECEIRKAKAKIKDLEELIAYYENKLK